MRGPTTASAYRGSAPPARTPPRAHPGEARHGNCPSAAHCRHGARPRVLLRPPGPIRLRSLPIAPLVVDRRKQPHRLQHASHIPRPTLPYPSPTSPALPATAAPARRAALGTRPHPLLRRCQVITASMCSFASDEIVKAALSQSRPRKDVDRTFSDSNRSGSPAQPTSARAEPPGVSPPVQALVRSSGCTDTQLAGLSCRPVRHYGVWTGPILATSHRGASA